MRSKVTYSSKLLPQINHLFIKWLIVIFTRSLIAWVGSKLVTIFGNEVPKVKSGRDLLMLALKNNNDCGSRGGVTGRGGGVGRSDNRPVIH